MRKAQLSWLALVVTPLALAADVQTERAVRDAIEGMAPNAKIDAMQPAIVPGFVEVVVGGQILYVTTDGRFLIHGSVWDTRSKRDLTESRRSTLRKDVLATVGDDQRIIFAATKRTHTVTVFTDIDCGYCRRLHQQIGEYNALGISVEYLFFPRAGLESESYAKAVSVWCAADRKDALTRAKRGETIEARTCANPVAEAFALGAKVGVTGTPMVIAEDGTQIGGYLDPPQMAARLEALRKPAQ